MTSKFWTVLKHDFINVTTGATILHQSI